MEKINVTCSSMPDFEEYTNEIKELWDSRWLTNMGKKHKEFEAHLEDYLGCKGIALYTNGHLALENALEYFNFPKGSEVITTPFTFVSTTHSITRSGLIPVFADVLESDYTINPDEVEKLITPKTVAIMPVHVYGNICQAERLQEIADKHNLKLIFDAAHAFGIKYKGVSVANLGDFSMFSFHATKVFNTIEGGALCYNDLDKTHRLNSLKNFGIEGPESIDNIGGNAKMNEFQAAMGICNLRHIEQEISKRKLVFDRYIERLSDVSGIKLCSPRKDITPNYAYFPVVFDGYKYTRDEIFLKLQKEGITARKYFYPLTNDCAAYSKLSTAGATKTPIAKHIASRVLTLPMYADLSLEVVDIICDIILD